MDAMDDERAMHDDNAPRTATALLRERQQVAIGRAFMAISWAVGVWGEGLVS